MRGWLSGVRFRVIKSTPIFVFSGRSQPLRRPLGEVWSQDVLMFSLRSTRTSSPSSEWECGVDSVYVPSQTNGVRPLPSLSGGDSEFECPTRNRSSWWGTSGVEFGPWLTTRRRHLLHSVTSLCGRYRIRTSYRLWTLNLSFWLVSGGREVPVTSRVWLSLLYDVLRLQTPRSQEVTPQCGFHYYHSCLDLDRVNELSNLVKRCYFRGTFIYVWVKTYIHDKCSQKWQDVDDR